MELTSFAQRLCDFLSHQPEIKSCRLYGSLSTGSWDRYSDIDIEIENPEPKPEKTPVRPILHHNLKKLVNNLFNQIHGWFGR